MQLVAGLKPKQDARLIGRSQVEHGHLQLYAAVLFWSNDGKGKGIALGVVVIVYVVELGVALGHGDGCPHPTQCQGVSASIVQGVQLELGKLANEGFSRHLASAWESVSHHLGVKMERILVDLLGLPTIAIEDAIERGHEAKNGELAIIVAALERVGR